MGNWKTLAKALGFEKTTMFNVKKGVNEVSINMAYRVSRLAGVAFDDVVTGKYPVPGTCPHCGRGAGVTAPPTGLIVALPGR